jgi:site-specific DNA recombinase
VRAFLDDPVEVLNAISHAGRDAPAHRRIRDAAAALAAQWADMPTHRVHDLMRAVIARAQVHVDRITLEVDSTRLTRRLLDYGMGEGSGPESHAVNEGDEGHLITLNILARLKRTGKEMKFIVDGIANSAPPDVTLIRLLVRAQKIGRLLVEMGSSTLDDIAQQESVSTSYVTRLVRLTFLAPDIIAAILAGNQPPELTANKLMADTRLPLDWRGQRTALGFA